MRKETNQHVHIQSPMGGSVWHNRRHKTVYDITSDGYTKTGKVSINGQVFEVKRASTENGTWYG